MPHRQPSASRYKDETTCAAARHDGGLQGKQIGLDFSRRMLQGMFAQGSVLEHDGCPSMSLAHCALL